MGRRYWGDWEFWRYERKKPRKAKEGIKAKSQRGKIGESWWSEKFIKVLESFNIGARLSRGRSYARSGQVMKLEIKPGIATSKVQGSRSTPYKVEIRFEPFSEKDWASAEKAMAAQAVFMAKLLAGEMPHEIEEAFTSCSLSVFPKSTRDLKTNCSCPDWSNPCKHIAATYYILAEKFDEDPFLIFAWRGRTKDQLIKHLRALRGASTEKPSKDASESNLEFVLPSEKTAPLSECLNNYWAAGAELSSLNICPNAAEIPDAILMQLGPAPVEVAGKNLKELLSPAYKAIAIEAERKAMR